MEYRAIVDRLIGPLVAVVPAFTSDQRLDIKSTCQWVQWITDAGVPMLWLTPGTTRYTSLTDQEILDLTRAVAGVTRGKALLIASTNHHWPVHFSRNYIQHCAEWGADIVKIVPHAGGVANEEMCFRFYRDVAEDSPLPLFAYTAAPILTVSLLNRLLDLPQYVGMKNDTGDFYEHRDYLWTARQRGVKFAPMTGGSLMSFLWGYDFGARAFCSGLGIVAPQRAIEFHQSLVSANRERALKIVHEVEEPLLADLAPFGGWQSLRAGLVHMGLFPSCQDRYPFRTLTSDEANRVQAILDKYGCLGTRNR
jgi:dihydrodipicolinate synthase/N-acetylneuraminate lyase